jgi:hypothetical protein
MVIRMEERRRQRRKLPDFGYVLLEDECGYFYLVSHGQDNKARLIVVKMGVDAEGEVLFDGVVPTPVDLDELQRKFDALELEKKK